PYFVLVALVVGVALLQSKQSQRSSPNLQGQMAVVTKVLPVGFGLLSLVFPAGLVLYFFVSSLWRLGQQEIILRHITGPMLAAGGRFGGGAIDVKSAEAVPKEPKPASAGPTTPGGGALRRMFQLPPAAAEGSGARSGNGSTGSSGRGRPAPNAGRTGTPKT